MMAYEIRQFKEYLDLHDSENRELRRVFHENYEWLEGYFRSRWGNNGFNTFCNKFGEHCYTKVAGIPELANRIGEMGPIGDSTDPNYEPNVRVKDATFLLRSGNGTAKERFLAMMRLVRQIRNNLFHGKKMELVQLEIYNRNKDLVRIGSEITSVLLEHLEQAERDLGL